jgi:hypothetical protein
MKVDRKAEVGNGKAQTNESEIFAQEESSEEKQDQGDYESDDGTDFKIQGETYVEAKEPGFIDKSEEDLN